MNRSRHATELSASDEWATPAWLFDFAKRSYGPFDLDAAAAPWNAKCLRFFTREDGALQREWGQSTWCNCPYSTGNKEAFTRWGRLNVWRMRKPLSCHLLPVDSADGYWSRHIEAPAGRLHHVTKAWSQLGPVVRTSWAELDVDVLLLNRRVDYVHESGTQVNNSRHPSALVTFARPGYLRPLVQTFGNSPGAA